MVETVHPQSSSDMFSPGIEDAERVTSTPRIKRYCGLSRYPFFGLLAVVILIAALGLGLGLHFGLDKPKGGAQKGSGVVAIDSGENIPLITAYHQDRSGIIRQDIYRNGIWSMANDTVVTSDARDGSPLMALVYAMHGELTWRVLYVDKEDYLQEVINSNKSTGWTTGPLGSGRFKASNSSQVGLSACWNYEYYGRNNKGGGIRLYYGSAEGSVKELGWSYGSTAWDYLASFPSSNPDGGVECTVHEMVRIRHLLSDGRSSSQDLGQRPYTVQYPCKFGYHHHRVQRFLWHQYIYSLPAARWKGHSASGYRHC